MAADSIVAVATGAARAGIGVLRLSGPRAHEIAQALTSAPLPQPGRFAYRRFGSTADDGASQIIDDGLLLIFAAPNSYTGEDVAELQIHGSPLLLAELQRASIAAGARAARPGEFTERAYLNDRMDLSQAEAVADLIDAASLDAARAARRSLDGAFSERVEALQVGLNRLRVHVEGALDFSDEDVDWLSDAGFQQALDQQQAEFAAVIAAASRGRRLRDGLSVAIIGRPNVGKSTLLNRLAGHQAAIVTDIPGTTRDILREQLELDGLPITLLDTAGLRDSADPVEAEGVRRAWASLERADLLLYLLDDRDGLTADDAAFLQRVPEALAIRLLHTKQDLTAAALQSWDDELGRHLRLSAQTGAGIDGLLAYLTATIYDLSTGAEFSARARHLQQLQIAHGLLQQAAQRIAEVAPAELAAEDLRAAQQALGEISGQISADDLLGQIFSSFCIGK